MPIAFTCLNGHRLTIDERHAGKRVRCPKCSAESRIPAAPGTSALSAANVVGAAATAGPSAELVAVPDASQPNEPAVPPPLPSALSSPPREPAVDVVESPTVGYRADNRHRQMVFQLGLGLFVLALFHLAPAARHYNLATAPDWARIIVFLALVELTYAAWMMIVPDWGTVWVAMLVMACVSAMYGMGLAIALFTPLGHPVLFELDDVHARARLWCAAALLASCLATYVCGRVSARWHKRYMREYPADIAPGA